MKYSFKKDIISGFSHKIPNSLINSDMIQQSGVILPLKNSLRFYNGLKSKQIIQTERDISAVAMTGPYIAIGVKGYLGQLITTYFLNIYESQNVKKMCYQKTKISKMAISKDGKYLCSLGHTDDKTQDFVIINTKQNFQIGMLLYQSIRYVQFLINQVIVCYNIATKIFYRKTIKGKQKIVDIVFSQTNPLFFALMYIDKLYFMKINQQTEQVEQTLIKSNRVRQFNKIVFDGDDRFCYTASKNGDIAEIDIEKGKEIRVGPKKRIIIAGIKMIKKIDQENMLIVGQKGFLAVVEIKQLKIIKQVTLNQAVHSITDFVDGYAFISTQKAIIYKLLSDTLQAKPFYICIKQKINQISVCQSNPDSILTSSSNQIIVWNVKDLKPQLKIALPKIQCSSVCIDKYGKLIVSAWSDNSIRIFTAYNGKIFKKMENCHPGPVTKVIIDYNQTKIISGGQKGEIKAWMFSEEKMGISLGSMSHHNKRINQLKINPQKFQQLICCCQDGKYSIWNLQTFDLVYCFYVCSFLKDCYFSDVLTIHLVGSGSYIYKVIKANGKIIQKVQLNNSHTNCVYNFQNLLENNIVIYGGEKQYLYLINDSLKIMPHVQENVYGEVTALKILPDKETIMIGTNDGILVKIQMREYVIDVKKEEEQEQQLLFSQLI